MTTTPKERGILFSHSTPMTPEQKAITEFMQKAEQLTPARPIIPSPWIAKLRVRLIQEELDELRDAAGSIVSVADAIGDLLYVVLGTAVAYGIDLEPVFWEIHRSNMSKFIDGERRSDGKWIKGPSYSPADLEPIIRAQQS